MNLQECINNESIPIEKEKIFFNEPMKKYTTFKIGGPAECLIKITNIESLKKILQFANANKIPITVIGNGSNILVSDKGIKGITLIIKIEKLKIENHKNKVDIIVGAGEKIGKLSKVFLENEITGFEEISGIPGTIGGAVRMNAGAYGKEMKDIVKKVICVDYYGNEKVFTNQEMDFTYRGSRLKKQKYIITEVQLELQKGKKETIEEKIKEYIKIRKEKQPIEFANAGSTFKRGNDFITAKLIEEAGLKGYSIGGAQVSTKHSGFIVNKKDATAKDVLQLANYIEKKIYKQFNKKIEIIGEII